MSEAGSHSLPVAYCKHMGKALAVVQSIWKSQVLLAIELELSRFCGGLALLGDIGYSVWNWTGGEVQGRQQAEFDRIG